MRYILFIICALAFCLSSCFINVESSEYAPELRATEQGYMIAMDVLGLTSDITTDLTMMLITGDYLKLPEDQRKVAMRNYLRNFSFSPLSGTYTVSYPVNGKRAVYTITDPGTGTFDQSEFLVPGDGRSWQVRKHEISQNSYSADYYGKVDFVIAALERNGATVYEITDISYRYETHSGPRTGSAGNFTAGAIRNGPFDYTLTVDHSGSYSKSRSLWYPEMELQIEYEITGTRCGVDNNLYPRWENGVIEATCRTADSASRDGVTAVLTDSGNKMEVIFDNKTEVW